MKQIKAKYHIQIFYKKFTSTCFGENFLSSFNFFTNALTTAWCFLVAASPNGTILTYENKDILNRVEFLKQLSNPTEITLAFLCKNKKRKFY